MSEIFAKDGYTFEEIKADNPERPFKVKCLQTGDTKDSSIGSIEAADLLVDIYKFHENVSLKNNKDKEYVKKVFEEVLRDRKRFECDNLVKLKIVDERRLSGTIISIKDNSEYLKYATEQFIVKVYFNNGFRRAVTDIVVENKERE